MRSVALLVIVVLAAEAAVPVLQPKAGGITDSFLQHSNKVNVKSRVIAQAPHKATHTEIKNVATASRQTAPPISSVKKPLTKAVPVHTGAIPPQVYLSSNSAPVYKRDESASHVQHQPASHAQPVPKLGNKPAEIVPKPLLVKTSKPAPKSPPTVLHAAEPAGNSTDTAAAAEASDGSSSADEHAEALSAQEEKIKELERKTEELNQRLETKLKDQRLNKQNSSAAKVEHFDDGYKIGFQNGFKQAFAAATEDYKRMYGFPESTGHTDTVGMQDEEADGAQTVLTPSEEQQENAMLIQKANYLLPRRHV